VVRKNLQGHESRNTKTAMMFTIALSFLIFAGSTFELIGHLIISQLESTIGTDLYAASLLSKTTYLDEGPISQFLQIQKEQDGAVQSYSFASAELGDLLKQLAPNTNNVRQPYIGPACGYNQVKVNVFGLQENYLQVVNTDYYMPAEIQSGLSLRKVANGDYDAV